MYIYAKTSYNNLYHTTDILHAIEIIESDKLESRNETSSLSATRVCFTRDKNKVILPGAKSPIQFVVDADKLKTQYKVVPYSEYGSAIARGYSWEPDPLKIRYESEERVVSRDIYPLSKYLVRVDVPDSILSLVCKQIQGSYTYRDNFKYLQQVLEGTNLNIGNNLKQCFNLLEETED